MSIDRTLILAVNNGYATRYVFPVKTPCLFPALSVILPFVWQALFLKVVGELTLNSVFLWITSVSASTELAIERNFNSEWLRYEWVSVSCISLEKVQEWVWLKAELIPWLSHHCLRVHPLAFFGVGSILGQAPGGKVAAQSSWVFEGQVQWEKTGSPTPKFGPDCHWPKHQ